MLKRNVTISTALESFVVLLGITSSVNTFAYIMHIEHSIPTAVTTSVVLGLALIISALAASRIDRRGYPGWFLLAIVITGAFAVVSGGLQTALHYYHSTNWLYSVGLGFVLPVVGEIGGPLVASAMKRIERERALREVSAQIEATIADNLSHALAAFDPARIEKHIDKTINSLAIAAVTDVSNRVRRYYVEEAHTVKTFDTEPTEQPRKGAEASEAAKSNDISNMKPQADAVRSNGKQAALERTIEFFRTHPNGSLADAEQFVGRKKSTISGYLNELEQQGRANVNGSVQILV
ncbi:hypothetical protein KFU94_09050 [Chloroflexi bacterium TSY]|nr:hypothetical protein [Chloroflexi bacterium TSY]